MNIRYFISVVAFAAMLMVGACSSDSDDVTPGTPTGSEQPGNPDDSGNQVPGDGSEDSGDDNENPGGTGGDPGDDVPGDNPDDGAGDSTDPEADVLTAKALKGVWSGSDGVVYYFYANGNLYTDNNGTYGAGTWTLFENNQTIKVGNDTNPIVYKEEAPSTITFDDGLVLTAMDEYLPDETRFITVENKEIVPSIGAMSSVTWVPEEI